MVQIIKFKQPVDCDRCDDSKEIDVGCYACGGSGEGPADGSQCMICRGSGGETIDCPDCGDRRYAQV